MIVAKTEGLSPEMFARFCDLVYESAGIHLGPQKEALVSARIGKRMRALGIQRYEDYYKLLRDSRDGDEMVEMLNAISTNVTQFYREGHHFKLLHSLLSDWCAAGQTRFRIWCAASSTGEEPYTLAMTVRESPACDMDVRILATDISTKALHAAKTGRYEARHVQPVPDALLRKYFEKTSSEDGTARYVVKERLRSMLAFSRLNLAHPPYPMKGPFDVVMCRNVMIYFDNRVRKALLDEAWRLLRPGGYLMVGHAESLSGLLSNFRNVQPSVYIK
jgi:chemotaxis protein methyltransferase CheR